MAGASYADVDDYREETGEAAEDTATVTRQLASASAFMRSEAPGLDARLTADTVEAELVTAICVHVVQRYRANPTGASQLLKGPFSAAYAAKNAQGMWLTEDELGQLSPPVASTAPRGVGSIRLGVAVRPNSCRTRW